MAQIVERALGRAQGFYYCAICDTLIEDLGTTGIIMFYDEDGIYHMSCFEQRLKDQEAKANQLTLWEDE